MLNIANSCRNANQNYNEVSPHTVTMAIMKKSLQTINAEEDVKKREPSCNAGKNVNWFNYYAEQDGDSLTS